MSGNGLISVRIPRSLMTAFEASASREGMDTHGAARQLIRQIVELSDDELVSLPEPETEADNPRISLYVGLPQIETLTAASDRTQLSMSRIVRRLIYRLIVGGSVQMGASEETLGLRQVTDNSASFALVFVSLAIVAIGAVLLYLRARNRKRKHLAETKKARLREMETKKEADLQ